MSVFVRLLYGFVLFEVTSAFFSPDPCRLAMLLDEPTRSAGYQVKDTDYESLLCDQLQPVGWYKFSGGNSIPETCPPIYHCGTHVPIWLHGSHPSIADGIVTIETCAHTPSSCCGDKDHIRVKNCGTFYAYELQPPPACSSAYCAGTGVPCPPDKWSPTGFMPGCIPAYPKMTHSPQLSNPILKPETFVFNCHIPYDSTKTDVGFQVTWQFDGKPDQKVPVTQVTGSGRDAELDQKYLQGHLGTEVSCAVKTYFLKSPINKGPPVPSNPYWAGIKLSTPRLTVGKNELPKTVQLISTIPIVCNKALKPSCRLDINLEPNNKNLTQTSSCKQTISPSDWNNKTNQAVTSFQVIAERHGGNQLLEMHFHPVHSYDAPPVFNNSTLPVMQIQTKDKDTAVCTCWGDPHCLTLDQQLAGLSLTHNPYNAYKLGEFTMYKSTSRPFEVQIRTWHCGSAICNCGVVAREGNDVITIDMCHGTFGHSFPKVRHQCQQSQGTVVHTNGARDEFLIYFPSGAWVKAKVRGLGQTLEISVHAPESDYDSTQGLCGTFNGNIADDQTDISGHVHPWSVQADSFVESWRIQVGTSMFDKEVKIDPKLNNDVYYCNCDQQKKLVDCTIDHKAYHPPAHTWCASCNSTLSCHKKRSLNTAVESGVADYNFDYGFLWVPTLGKFPTKSGFTHASAEKACNDSFNANPVIQKCISQIGIDVKPVLSSCVEDIKQMDNLHFIESAMDVIIMICIEIATKNPVYLDNSTGLPPAFITTDRCPLECYRKGVCIHGQCRCNAGYTGDACEINTTQPPSLFAIETTNLYVRTADTCDVTVTSCKSITVIGDNIAPSPKLHCRLTELKLDGSKFYPTGKTVTVRADYIGIYSAACMLPVQPANHGLVGIGYNISVTNNGVDFSTSTQVFITDPTCLSCPSNGGFCSIMADTCLIDGVCRTKGETSHSSSNHVCDPARNNNWSEIRSPTIPYPVAPLGGTPLARFDVWTTTKTGCPCNHNNASMTCACCDDGGCQCPGSNAHQCTHCGDQAACGSPQTAPIFGVDGYTLALSDCECKFDPTKFNCACCQDNENACQCPIEHRNQCVDCQHMDGCGSKPWIFGPAMPST